MPFSKYFADDPPNTSTPNDNGLQFQLPSFMHSGPPTLARGGGAEVLHFNSNWFNNNSGVYSQEYTPLPHLPIYSASGFDVLSLLARIASRPNPTINLGPVDLTTSFVVVDTRRHDHPIVYCSPSFTRLTGYAEHEVLGRNCRFLQAPPSADPVRKGERRRFTSTSSVDALRKALTANKEVQTSIVNFRKNGSAFINLVSVIPVYGGERNLPHEAGDVVYHVGFQVDLTEQPNTILDKLREGSYLQLPPCPPAASPAPTQPPPQRKANLPALIMSPLLSRALTNKALLSQLPITTSTTALSPLPSTTMSPSSPTTTTPASTPNSPLSLLLLEYAPDFILVVSLKGFFLYVAPSILSILGHPPSSLVGRSLSDLAHPEDVVPLERQLKESSTLLPSADQSQPQAQARLIDVLFRAKTITGRYVWVEARGRLHVEPGKGRKAIVLSARARGMPCVHWGDVLPAPTPDPVEFWATLSGLGPSAGAIVSTSSSASSLLCPASPSTTSPSADLLGRRITSFIPSPTDKSSVEHILRALERGDAGRRAVCYVRVGDAGTRVRMVFYPSPPDDSEPQLGIAPPVVLLHVSTLPEGYSPPHAYSPSSSPSYPWNQASSSSSSSSWPQPHSPSLASPPDPENPDPEPLHPPTENIFAELDTRRGSSWQYELQQLRFRNLRLREEVRALEAEAAGACSGVEGGAGEELELELEYSEAEGQGQEFAYDPPQQEVEEVVEEVEEERPTAYVSYPSTEEPPPAPAPVYDELDIALGLGGMYSSSHSHSHSQSSASSSSSYNTTAIGGGYEYTLHHHHHNHQQQQQQQFQPPLPRTLAPRQSYHAQTQIQQIQQIPTSSSSQYAPSPRLSSGQTQTQTQIPTTSSSQYAPTPRLSSSSGLLHALGGGGGGGGQREYHTQLGMGKRAGGGSQHQAQHQLQHQHQAQHQIQHHQPPQNPHQHQYPHPNPTSSLNGWGHMHPGIKRALGR